MRAMSSKHRVFDHFPRFRALTAESDHLKNDARSCLPSQSKVGGCLATQPFHSRSKAQPKLGLACSLAAETREHAAGWAFCPGQEMLKAGHAAAAAATGIWACLLHLDGTEVLMTGGPRLTGL